MQSQKPLADIEVRRRQFVSALHMPEGFTSQTLLLVNESQPGISDDVLRVRAENAAEQLERVFVLALGEACFGHQAITIQVFGIIAQDVLADCKRVVIPPAVDMRTDLVDKNL